MKYKFFHFFASLPPHAGIMRHHLNDFYNEVTKTIDVLWKSV